MNALRIVTLGVVWFVSTVACSKTPPVITPPTASASPRSPDIVELTAAGLVTAQIRVERASAETFTPHIRVPADIQSDPERMAHIGARTPGRVVGLMVHLGDHVQRGQAIAEIDTVELHQVSMEFLTAIARERQSADAVARQRQLVNERVGAEVDLRRAEADEGAALAALREGEEHLHFLGLDERAIHQLRSRTSHGEARSSVRSPIEGRVESVTVSIGQVVAGTEDLATVAQLDSVWASLRVYERDAENVRLGTPVAITTPGVPERSFSGAVTFVSALVDPISRTFEARVLLDNRDGLLRPGMSATANVAVRDTESHLWVPVEAVQPHDAERVVFVEVGERRYAVRTVSIGEERNGYVPVLEGLHVGDALVVHGAFALRGELERAALDEE